MFIRLIANCAPGPASDPPNPSECESGQLLPMDGLPGTVEGGARQRLYVLRLSVFSVELL